jgi:saccharopine dehydrogenase-like NADP-dependent oxidoreductase
VKKWPFCYKAPFSPIDVIEEYTRPARYIENGVLVTREALSDCEYVEFDGVGTLESFNTDGLRSMLYTLPHIRDMKEKTLRYPGHVEFIKALRESGFFSTQKIQVKDVEISPLEVTGLILINEWKLAEGEPEFTVMRITIKGTDKTTGREQTVVYDLYDEYHPATGITSMARTTGYTATAAANLLLNGLFADKGVFPPELVGKKAACFEFVIQYLSERRVKYRVTGDKFEV